MTSGRWQMKVRRGEFWLSHVRHDLSAGDEARRSGGTFTLCFADTDRDIVGVLAVKYLQAALLGVLADTGRDIVGVLEGRFSELATGFDGVAPFAKDFQRVAHRQHADDRERRFFEIPSSEVDARVEEVGGFSQDRDHAEVVEVTLERIQFLFEDIRRRFLLRRRSCLVNECVTTSPVK